MKQFNKNKALRKISRKQNKEKYMMIGSISLSITLIIISIMFFAFAKFESFQEYTLLKGKVGGFQSGDYLIGAYIDGEKSENIPSKDSGYYLQKVECSNGAEGTWDSISWELTVSNISAKTQCYVYFTTTLALADSSGNYSTTLKNYPIGSIYQSVNSTSPSTLFGGTWERIGNGKTLVGVDENDSSFNTVEKTGGEKNHTLTVNEMPSHDHSFGTYKTRSDGSNSGPYKSIPTMYSEGSSNNFSKPASGNGATNYTAKGNLIIWPNGGSQAHNNLQPYITVYMWKRTA